VLVKVKANKGWLPRAVADPAYSSSAKLEDFYRCEQAIYVCLPHVSTVPASLSTCWVVVEDSL
jgi:hypothetical protein